MRSWLTRKNISAVLKIAAVVVSVVAEVIATIIKRMEDVPGT